ncbi:unnamed protein product [Adineta ricciae]|uniref:Uncharacterized protein n=1 Tax=Adineta ricciae TaxID=249248 RepID=A0A815YI20_ADIRI|nr:unnamed protein product [Adineta ricciae]CAF1570538.1 unnamed protein product [Adineta ricciae]
MWFIQHLVTSIRSVHFDFPSTKAERSLNGNRILGHRADAECVSLEQGKHLDEKRFVISSVLPIIDGVGNQSSPVDQNEDFLSKKGKTIVVNDNISCVHFTLRNLIYLLYIILLACLLAIFLFTFICNAIDTYWFRQSTLRNSSQWSTDNYKTDSAEFDSDLNSTIEVMYL